MKKVAFLFSNPDAMLKLEPLIAAMRDRGTYDIMLFLLDTGQDQPFLDPRKFTKIAGRLKVRYTQWNNLDCLKQRTAGFSFDVTITRGFGRYNPFDKKDFILAMKNVSKHVVMIHHSMPKAVEVDPNLFSKILVWGPYGKEVIEGGCLLKLKPGQVEVVGSPFYDEIVEKYKDYNVLAGTIVFALQGQDTYPVCITEICDYVRAQHPKKYLVFKLHPGCEPGPITEWIFSATREYSFQHPKRMSILREANIAELVAKCDILVSMSSTVLITALVLDKDIIMLGNHPQPALIAQGSAYRIESPGQILGVFDAIYKNPYAQESARECREKSRQYYVLLDGKANERIMAVIDSLE